MQQNFRSTQVGLACFLHHMNVCFLMYMPTFYLFIYLLQKVSNRAGRVDALRRKKLTAVVGRISDAKQRTALMNSKVRAVTSFYI